MAFPGAGSYYWWSSGINLSQERMVLAIVFLVMALVCYSIRELHAHSKLKWQKGDDSFWGENSWFRKYKLDDRGHPIVELSRNWYNKIFGVDFKERWPTSATFTVFLTDGMHLMQAMFFLFLSLSVTFAMGFEWLLLAGVYLGIHIVHFLTYKLLSR